MEERQRLQQRYERLLRERAAASLMGEAAAAAAQAEGYEARHGVGNNPNWYPPSYLQAPTQQGHMVINPAPVQAATTMLSQGGNINLSRQAAQWRTTRPSVQGGATLAGPFQVHGPQGAGTSTGAPPAYAPLGRTYAAYAQATGSPSTYSQAPRPSVPYGPAPGPTVPQPQPAGSSAAYAHVTGHPPPYNPGQREDSQMQSSSFDSFQAESPGSYVYSEQQSTSTLHRVYIAPPVATGPTQPCPPNANGPREGPPPQEGAGYPPVTSSVGPSQAGPWVGYIGTMSLSAKPSKTQTPPRTGYARVPTSSAGPRSAQAPPRAGSGYRPMTSSVGPNQAQIIPRYFRSVSPETPGYWEFIPAPGIFNEAVNTQSHQPGPSRHRPNKRAAPFSGRRTSFRPVLTFNSSLEASQSAGQAPTGAPIKVTKSVPSKYEGGKRLRPIQLKRNDRGYEIKKEPGEEISARRDADRGRYHAGMKPTAEIKPEAHVYPVADVDQEGDVGPEKDPEAEEVDEGGNEFDVEEYEPGEEDELGDDSGCSDGDNEELTDTWRQIPLPPPAPWAAEAFTGEPGEPRPATCANCGRVTIPGLLCVGCCWKPTPEEAGEEPMGPWTGYYHGMLYFPQPGSCPLPLVYVCFTVPVVDTSEQPNQPSDYHSRASAAAGGSGPATAGGSGTARAPASMAGGQTAPTRRVAATCCPRTADSSVQVEFISDSECESCSADGEEIVEETEEEEEAEEEGEEGEEGDGDQDQQESADEAVEKRNNPDDLPQQETPHSTATASEVPEKDKEEEQGTEEGER